MKYEIYNSNLSPYKDNNVPLYYPTYSRDGLLTNIIVGLNTTRDDFYMICFDYQGYSYSMNVYKNKINKIGMFSIYFTNNNNKIILEVESAS